jgi:VWFA-related protein
MNSDRSSNRVIGFFTFLALPFGIGFIFGTGRPVPQVIRQEASVVNIEVPVRVFDGNRFVDNLTLNDFEVFENGLPQKVEAAYLIRKTSVLRNAAIESGAYPGAPLAPPAEIVKKRHFVFIFEMDEYLPQLGKAVDLFFSDVLAPGDTLRIITPENSWEIKKGELEKKSRANLAEELKSKLRKSLTLGGSQIRRLIMDIRISAQDSSGLADDDWASAGPLAIRDFLEQLVSLKTMNIRQYEKFAKFLKPLEGQKNAIIFYQKESYVLPKSLEKMYAEALGHRREFIDQNEIKKIFSDANTTAHFLFLNKTRTPVNDVEYQKENESMPVEMSGDFFQAFRNLANATGGISESTANPIYGFKKALEAVENYYLVYYKPAVDASDGKYKEIKVRVKGDRYRVTHRAGYIDK